MIRRWTALGVVTAEEKFRRIKAIAIWALSFTRLEANRNLLTAMRLLPKSIHRCHRYPTKFNSGRDIPRKPSALTALSCSRPFANVTATA